MCVCVGGGGGEWGRGETDLYCRNINPFIMAITSTTSRPSHDHGDFLNTKICQVCFISPFLVYFASVWFH